MKTGVCIVFCFQLFIQTVVADQHLPATLSPGKHSVGFQVIDTVDLTRPPFAGTGPAERLPAGRPMRFFLWYPAEKGTGQELSYAGYVSLMNDCGKSGLQSERGIFFHTLAELSGDTSLFVPIIDSLLQSHVMSRKNAALAKGRFPLLIYPDRPHVQHILCEWLASHGFMVLSPQYAGPFSSSMEYDIRGVETAVNDLSFALGYMRKHFEVSKDFAVMGTGFAATIGLALQMRNQQMKALVSLEGGITTGFEEKLIQQSPFFDLQRCNQSMLIIHAPHPDVKPELTYKYKYSERIYQNYPQSSEFYFLNFGLWEKRVSPIFANANRGNTWDSYSIAANSVLNYLEWKLTGNEKARTLLFKEERPATILQTSFKKANPLPPTLAELSRIMKNSGMEELKSIYNKRKEEDPEPFPFTLFYRFGEELFNGGKYDDCIVWGNMYAEQFGHSSIPWSLLAKASVQKGLRLEARAYFEKALILLPSDELLSEQEKSWYRPVFEKGLKDLGI